MELQKSANHYFALKANLGAGADSSESEEQRVATVKFFSSKINREIEAVAEWLHDNYEEIAKQKEWDTQKSCKVQFPDLPENNKRVMIELSRRILENIGSHVFLKN